MLSAFLGAIGNVVDVVQGKYILSQEHMPFKAYITLQNFFIFVVMIGIFYFFGDFTFEGIRPIHYLLFTAVVVVACVYNYLFAYAMKKGKICNIEPIAMMHPLITMLLAVAIYPDERDWSVLVPALIAGFVLVYSRIEKHHLKLNKYTLAISAFSVLIATEAVMAKSLLEVLPPITFYTLRIGFVSLLFLMFVRPNLRKVDGKLTWHVFINSAVIALEYVFIYTAIKQVGLVVTSLILLLAPALILLISNYLFKEKMGLKKAMADAIILICIAVAILIK